jgi:glutathione S-transferase
MRSLALYGDSIWGNCLKVKFVCERLGLADIALVAYTRWAHEGGFDLDRFIHCQGLRVEEELGLAHAR